MPLTKTQYKNYYLLAKVKFWFGASEDIFRKELIVEYSEDRQYAYIYKRRQS